MPWWCPRFRVRNVHKYGDIGAENELEVAMFEPAFRQVKLFKKKMDSFLPTEVWH
jgi:hypothetical protein